jgi:hypothetical protein
LKRKPWLNSKKRLINKLKACSSNNKWCSNNLWCSKCTSPTLWCQMLTFNSNKWCSHQLKCFNNQILTLRNNNRQCNNQILWICQHKHHKFHRISGSNKCSSKTSYPKTSSKLKQFLRTKYSHQSSKTFYHHQWWNYLKLIKLQQIKVNQSNQSKSIKESCTHPKNKPFNL